MNITSAKYFHAKSPDGTVETQNVGIDIVIDGEKMSVPLVPGNRHYDEIQRQVAAGDLTIADAD